VFLSSHLLAEVGQVCDQVAVIHEGRLAGQGPVSQLATEEAFLQLTGTGETNDATARR
jgi:ABC-2 type transport system ATP-binding protein